MGLTNKILYFDPQIKVDPKGSHQDYSSPLEYKLAQSKTRPAIYHKVHCQTSTHHVGRNTISFLFIHWGDYMYIQELEN